MHLLVLHDMVSENLTGLVTRNIMLEKVWCWRGKMGVFVHVSMLCVCVCVCVCVCMHKCVNINVSVVCV